MPAPLPPPHPSATTVALSAATPLARAERADALTRLAASGARVIDATGDVTRAQWSFRAAPGRWSIGEIVEHLAVTERAVLAMVRGPLMRATRADAARRAEAAGKDALVDELLADRTVRSDAPERLRPLGRRTARDATLAAFVAARRDTLDYVRVTADDLRGHVLPHPALGVIDAYQWLLFLAAHADRHVAQIDEARASAGFPR